MFFEFFSWTRLSFVQYSAFYSLAVGLISVASLSAFSQLSASTFSSDSEFLLGASVFSSESELSSGCFSLVHTMGGDSMAAHFWDLMALGCLIDVRTLSKPSLSSQPSHDDYSSLNGSTAARDEDISLPF